MHSTPSAVAENEDIVGLTVWPTAAVLLSGLAVSQGLSERQESGLSPSRTILPHDAETRLKFQDMIIFVPVAEQRRSNRIIVLLSFGSAEQIRMSNSLIS